MWEVLSVFSRFPPWQVFSVVFSVVLRVILNLKSLYSRIPLELCIIYCCSFLKICLQCIWTCGDGTVYAVIVQSRVTRRRIWFASRAACGVTLWSPYGSKCYGCLTRVFDTSCVEYESRWSRRIFPVITGSYWFWRRPFLSDACIKRDPCAAMVYPDLCRSLHVASYNKSLKWISMLPLF